MIPLTHMPKATISFIPTVYFIYHVQHNAEVLASMPAVPQSVWTFCCEWSSLKVLYNIIHMQNFTSKERLGLNRSQNIIYKNMYHT